MSLRRIRVHMFLEQAMGRSLLHMFATATLIPDKLKQFLPLKDRWKVKEELNDNDMNLLEYLKTKTGKEA